jgi:hypothetical protein
VEPLNAGIASMFTVFLTISGTFLIKKRGLQWNMALWTAIDGGSVLAAEAEGRGAQNAAREPQEQVLGRCDHELARLLAGLDFRVHELPAYCCRYWLLKCVLPKCLFEQAVGATENAAESDRARRCSKVGGTRLGRSFGMQKFLSAGSVDAASLSSG